MVYKQQIMAYKIRGNIGLCCDVVACINQQTLLAVVTVKMYNEKENEIKSAFQAHEKHF